MNTMFSLTLAILLLFSAAQAQQANPQRPEAAQQQSTDELLKTLTPQQRAELLKRLQASAPQAQQAPAGESVAPPPKAQGEPKTSPSTPPKAKAPAGCEGQQLAGKAARIGGLWWYKARVAIAQKTGADVVGMAEEAAKNPCKPAQPQTESK